MIGSSVDSAESSQVERREGYLLDQFDLDNRLEGFDCRREFLEAFDGQA